MERLIHIRYGWIEGEPETSSWESTLFREWSVLILVVLVIALRIFPAILYALGFIFVSMVFNAAISLTMLPKARSVEIYVEPNTSLKIKDLFFSGKNSVLFLVGAAVSYAAAFTFNSVELILVLAIILNSLYILPFVKKKFLEYSALKKEFSIISCNGVKPLTIRRDNESKYWLDSDGEVQLSYNEAKFLYDLYIIGSDESESINKFISLKKGFKSEDWTISPTPNAHIYLMIRKDFSKYINISSPDAVALLSGVTPEDLLFKINKLEEETSVYKKYIPDSNKVQFVGTYAIIETRSHTFLMDIESGRTYLKKRFICLIAGREHGVYSKNEHLVTLRQTYELDAKRMEKLSKIYHLASEESKTIRLLP